MDVKNILKETAKKFGMDMCGVASIDRFSEAPPGRHPTDILPGCRSVVVIGVRLLDGIVQANFRAFENDRDDLKGLYGTYGYTMLPNFELTYACYGIAQAIERYLGEIATPCSTGPMTNGNQISLRHCAVAAGLGEFGWMSIVLTPEFGPRNRFGVILTTAEIEPDPMYDGPPLCDPTSCTICTDSCPTRAIGYYGTDNCHSCTLGDKTYTYGIVDFPKCQVPTQGLRKEYGGAKDWVTSDEPTPQEIEEVNKQMPMIQRGLQMGMESWHCDRCLSYCPVGEWKSKSMDRDLSAGLTSDVCYRGPDV
ncbi:MAG: epoxyqueuosine reductase [Clostridiales bacterium]|nr:epoxyqueuosine reductase [Clostridiales bacterium]